MLSKYGHLLGPHCPAREAPLYLHIYTHTLEMRWVHTHALPKHKTPQE